MYYLIMCFRMHGCTDTNAVYSIMPNVHMKCFMLYTVDQLIAIDNVSVNLFVKHI